MRLIANHMKKSYLAWNRDSVTDEIIFNDLHELSGKQLTVKEGVKLTEQKEFQKSKPPQLHQNKKRMQMQRKKPMQ
jgi:hypothetical protein